MGIVVGYIFDEKEVKATTEVVAETNEVVEEKKVKKVTKKK